MEKAGVLQLNLPSDCEIAMTRVFDAPRHLVFEAYTRPELLKRWLGVRSGWSLAVCEINLRVGGAYRYVWRGPNRADMGMGGVYLDVSPPERIVATEKFDRAWYPGEAVGTTVMIEDDGRTTLTMTVRYQSREARDAVLRTPMKDGLAEGFDKLAELLPALARGGN